MSSPKISVALCTFNGEEFIQEQLLSILNQTIAPFELVISDDSSTDATLDLIEECCSGAQFPVVLLKNQSTGGVKANFEKAMSACTGDYIALADQDDIWLPEKLHLFTQAINAADTSLPTLFFSDLDLIDTAGAFTGHSFLSKAGVVLPANNEHHKLLAVGNFAPGCCTVFDRRLLTRILPIPAGAILHDWWINLLFSMCGRLEKVSATTMCYRIHAGNNQGIGTAARGISIGAQEGFVSTAKANLLAALDQVECARRRLEETDGDYPPVMDDLIAVFKRRHMLRPVALFRLGIHRGNALKTAVTLGASMFIDPAKIGANTSTYT